MNQIQEKDHNGIILINKSKGWTSHDVVNLIRQRFKFKKVGHCGTLDPNATGLLIIVIGKATKISERLMKNYKVYKTIMTLGQATDSQDSDGEIIQQSQFKHITKKQIQQVFNSILGINQQIPPMTSAIKHKGQPLYKLARKGISIERKSRVINIYKIEINRIKLPEINFTIICTKGTYIRTLCHDIGQKLQSCAYMSELIRLQSGPFYIHNALPISDIKKIDLTQLSPLITPLDDYLNYNQILHSSSLSELTYQGINKIAIAIGNFDGIHLGHRQILKQLIKQAKKNNSLPFIITFHPHPKTILTNNKISQINSSQQQIDIFYELGIKGIIHIPFSENFAKKTPQEFINEILKDKLLTITDICIGTNWKFGAKKKGNYQLLKKELPQTNIHPIDEIIINNLPISSTRIRQFLNQNKFDQIQPLLERPYAIKGRVEYGLQLATTQLNYPTANITNSIFLPLNGVFFVKVLIENFEYNGICNIGYKPTIEKKSQPFQTIEVHILKFQKNIYHQTITIIPRQKIRNEKKFNSLERLKLQISMDLIQVKKLL